MICDPLLESTASQQLLNQYRINSIFSTQGFYLLLFYFLF